MFKKSIKWISYFILLCCYAHTEPPSWNVDETAFVGNSSISAELLLNEVLQGDGNIIGAFVNGDCRGVGNPENYQGNWLYFLSVYGNENGDTLNFKAWIAETDTVLDIWEKVIYESNSSSGTPDNPIQLSAYLNFDFQPNLTGIPSQVIEIGTEFTDIDLNDYLTSLDGDPIIWTAEGENLTIQIVDGIASVNSNINTWTGSELVIFLATENTENSFADSDTVLFKILPLDNPPTLSEIVDQTIGTYGNFLDIDLNNYLTELDGDSIIWSALFSEPLTTDDSPSWSINPSSFEFNMSATIVVESNKVMSADSESVLAAFSSNGVIAGVTSPLEYGDKWIYSLTIYSNTNLDTVSFRFYNSELLQNFPVLENIIFSTNDIIGSPDDPFLLQAGNILVQLGTNGIASFDLIDKLWTGSESISFIAEDHGTLNNYTATNEVSLTVIQDFAPVISGIPDQAVEMGTLFSSFDVIDFVQIYDNDEVMYSFNDPQNLEVNIIGDIVSISAIDENWIGSNSIIFTVTDNSENSFTTSDTADFEILSLDDPPTLSIIEDQTVEIGQEFTSINLNTHLIELDGDSVAWSFEFLHQDITTVEPEWNVDASEYEYSMTVTAKIKSLGNPVIGSNHILAATSEEGNILGVSNGIEYLGNWLYFLTIYSNSPGGEIKFLFYDSEHQRILEGSEELIFSVNETNGGPDVPYEIFVGPIFASINSTNQIIFQTIDPIWEYPENLRITVKDQGTINEYSSSYDVQIMMDNDFPTISLDTLFVNEGSQFEPIDLKVVIMDNWSTFDSLDISISDQNLFELVITNDSLFVSIEDSNWFGENIVTFTIGDKHPFNPLISEIEIPFIVININDNPEISDIPDKLMDEDQILLFGLYAEDYEDDSLIYFSNVLSGEIVAEIIADSIILAPISDWSGTCVLQVIVDDQKGGRDTTGFNVLVSEINDPPLSRIDTLEGLEDEILSIMLSDCDVDTEDDSLLFSTVMLPLYGELILEGGLFSFNPGLNWSGIDSFKYVIYDGYLYSDTGTVYISVLPLNDKPIAKILNNQITSMQSQRLVIDGSMSFDFDNDSLDYFWEIDELFLIESEENRKIIINTPELDSDSVFQIILTVSDGSLLSDPDTLRLIIVNFSPNEILPSFAETEINLSESIPISVEIPQFFSVDSISLNYWNGENNFVSKEMITEGSTRNLTFSASIDPNSVGIKGVSYFVYAESVNGNKIQTDTTDIQVSFASNTVLSTMENSAIQNGLLKRKWMNISIPSELNDNSIASIFHSVLDGGPNNSKWMLYEWNDKKWIEPDKVVSGKGYWIKQIKNDRIDFSLGEGKTSKLSGLTIDLDVGWNLISSPYLFPVRVPSYDDQLSEIYYFDGNGWVDSTITHLLPWAGYAIFNYSDIPETLTLSPLDEDYLDNLDSVSEPEWTSTISVSANGYSDSKNIFGVHKESSNSFDLIDCPEPPTLGQYISLYSISPNSKTPYKRLTKDFRKLKEESLYVWDLELESTITDLNGEIKIQVEGDLIEHELWFLDMQNRDFSQLELGSSHFLDINKVNSNTVYYYKLIYGSYGEIQEYFSTVVPKKYSLHNNYPNPFNPITTIPFDIPNSSIVSISIYDVGGRIVKTLTEQNWPAGYHELQWNGQSSNGRMVGTGVYFIRMESEKIVQYKKMILLK